MSKKWYEHFISIESSEKGGPDTAAAEGDSAARQVAEIAKSIQVNVVAPPAQAPVAAPFAAAPLAAIKPGAKAPDKPMAFDEIYQMAEITVPPHGYSIYKIADMLRSPHIENLPAEVKRSSILLALDAAGVQIQQIVEDAIRRDKALDAFERMQLKQVEEFEAAKLEENRKYQAELDRVVAELKAKMEAAQKETAVRKEAFQTWRIQKQIEEQKIADTVAYFVTENPITTSGRGAK